MLNPAPITVDEVQSRIGSIVDQDEKTADISSSDYSLRLKYINIAAEEWADSYDWDELYREFNTQTSTASGNCSVSMPANFRKMASFPKISWDGNNTDQFPVARLQENSRFADTDKRVCMIGNQNTGYTMVVFGVTNGAMISGASIMVPYYADYGSLASPADAPEIGCYNYLIKRTVALIWQSREDPRYPMAQQEAEDELKGLINYENTFGEGNTNDRIRTTDETRSNFRWGKS
jgi:hypothetical protein